ncbi:cation-transporting P-type ATPase [Clostridium felsineum]|uniref:cation-transporting P-type ATPase n=1 Tax=Clostridium felsineum TaxID=36839 RepID=UPI00098C6BCE|nr:hypothetical protein CLFE_046530 [Clostridium felsineum DSM 794]
MELKNLISNINSPYIELIFKKFNTSLNGISEEEAVTRLQKYGLNGVRQRFV